MSPQPHRKIAGTRATAIGAKATTPTPDQRERARRNSGEISRARKERPLTPTERWETERHAVLERFKADMAERYADESDAFTVGPLEDLCRRCFTYHRDECL